MIAHFTLTLLFLSFFAYGQNDCEKYGQEYIPIDLADAINYLTCKWSEEDKNEFKNKEEQVAVSELHFGTGRAIRNEWGLWKGDSKISIYFNELGVFHAEGMSSIILTSFHRDLNNKDISLQTQINFIKEYWAEVKKKEAERKKKEFSEFNVGDQVEFLYDFDFVTKNQEEKYWNEECLAQGIIVGLDSAALKLKVKLFESCDKKGIVISKDNIYEKIDGKWVLKEKDKVEIMEKGEVMWTPYELWEVVE